MAMSVGNGNGAHSAMCDMNTTPLIDVMLVLLVMIILTVPIQTHAVRLDLPVRSGEPPPAPSPINLEIDFDGTPFWNGKVVPDRAELDSYFTAAAKQIPQSEVHLRPHRLSKYEVVARVLADAQRLGISKIGFIGNEQYTDAP
jgi:biopolymer transport protein ExbD